MNFSAFNPLEVVVHGPRIAGLLARFPFGQAQVVTMVGQGEASEVQVGTVHFLGAQLRVVVSADESWVRCDTIRAPSYTMCRLYIVADAT